MNNNKINESTRKTATSALFGIKSSNIESSDASSYINSVPKTDSMVASKVKSIVVDKLGVEEYEVTMNSSFVNDLGADSLDAVELIMEFEKVFEITISEEASENIRTVGDAVSYISSRV